MRAFALALLATLFTLAISPAALAEALVIENLGLKNTYRITFSEISQDGSFVTGRLEILGENDDRKVPHTKVPFSGTMRRDPANPGTELLTLSSDALIQFFPPDDSDDARPAIRGRLAGHGTGQPVLALGFWNYDPREEEWARFTMTFDHVPAPAAGGGKPDLLARASLGGIRPGFRSPATLEGIKCAAATHSRDGEIFKGESQFEAATGFYSQDWLVPTLGLWIKMESEQARSVS